jgi:hypothetical protein
MVRLKASTHLRDHQLSQPKPALVFLGTKLSPKQRSRAVVEGHWSWRLLGGKRITRGKSVSAH